jgi:hypothetical protein
MHDDVLVANQVAVSSPRVYMLPTVGQTPKIALAVPALDIR